MSSELSGDATNLDSVIGGSGVASGIAGGDVLTAYAEAALGDDEAEIAMSRSAVQSELGDAAVVDAAAVIANFQRMVRIADSTGIPIDARNAALSVGVRRELDLGRFASAANSPAIRRQSARDPPPVPPRSAASPFAIRRQSAAYPLRSPQFGAGPKA